MISFFSGIASAPAIGTGVFLGNPYDPESGLRLFFPGVDRTSGTTSEFPGFSGARFHRAPATRLKPIVTAESRLSSKAPAGVWRKALAPFGSSARHPARNQGVARTWVQGNLSSAPYAHNLLGVEYVEKADNSDDARNSFEGSLSA